MPIIIVDPIGERGKKDAKRHREKLHETIRNRLPEVIGEETIITGDRKRTIKIPIKGLRIPIFKPRNTDEEVGVGQGPGQVGDEAGEGDEMGENELETEVPMEELIEMMLEDLGLPNLKEKNIREIEIQLGWKIKGLSLVGPQPLLNRRKTAEAGIKRFWMFLRGLQKETGLDELVCFRALKQTQGNLKGALDLTHDLGKISETADSIVPFPITLEEDKRFFKLEESTQKQSNAVLIAIMDVSGSMDNMKKYLARSLLFWLVEFLRHQYATMAIRFIIHTDEAKIVDENTFFHTRESGGTQCSSGYELAQSLIESDYPPDAWNIYLWHFSDGDDSDHQKTAQVIQKLLPIVNMIGYGEVQPGLEVGTAGMFFGGMRKNRSHLWITLQNNLGLNERVSEGMPVIQNEHLPFLGVLATERTHIYPALREFLRKDRWTKP